MPEPSLQSKRGKGDQQSRQSVPYDGLPEASEGRSNGYQGVSGAFPKRGGPPQSVRHTETLVLARLRAGAQPLPGVYGEVQGGITDPISEGGATTP